MEEKTELKDADYLKSLGFLEHDLYVFKTSDYSYTIIKIIGNRVLITERSNSTIITEPPVIYTAPMTYDNKKSNDEGMSLS